MLKLVYSATGLTITRISKSLEKVVAQRAVLAVRLGQSLSIQKATCSVLFPKGLTGRLGEHLTLCVADREHHEITLTGTWLTTEPESEEGILLVILPRTLEGQIVGLWQTARLLASALAP